MNKKEITKLLNEVELLVQQQLSILQMLCEKYDQMQKFQQYNVEKSLKRIKNYFSIQPQDEYEKLPKLQQIEQSDNFIIPSAKVKKQEHFTIKDWQLIRKLCVAIDEQYEELLKFIQVYSLNKSHHLYEVEVDEKSYDLFDDKYYGYKMNGTLTGIGLEIRSNAVYYGYFLMNSLQEGVSVVYSPQHQAFKICIKQKEELLKVSIQLSQNLKNQKGQAAQIDQETSLAECLRVNHFFFESLKKQDLKMVKLELDHLIKAMYDIKLYQPEFFVLDTEYFGQAKHSTTQGKFYVKEGYGVYIEQIGLWKDDEFIQDFENYVKVFKKK